MQAYTALNSMYYRPLRRRDTLSSGYDCDAVWLYVLGV